MLKSGSSLDLSQEALCSHHGRQLRLQDLEGHVPMVFQVFCKIDRGHAALAELPVDAIAAL